jgi:hypothetical protein
VRDVRYVLYIKESSLIGYRANGVKMRDCMARLVLQMKSGGKVNRSNNKGLQLHYIKSDNFYHERCTSREQTYSDPIDISLAP